MDIRESKAFTLVEIMIVVVIIGIVAAIGLPNLFRVTTIARRNTCISNLKQIDSAVTRWAIDNNITAGTDPDEDQEAAIYAYLKTGKPHCPEQGIYTIDTAGSSPQVHCTREAEGHVLEI